MSPIGKASTRTRRFGKIVASLRRERRWTQEELGDETGLGSIIIEVENGRRAGLWPEELLKLANAFRLSSRERKEFFSVAIDIPDEHAAQRAKSEDILKQLLAMAGQVRLPVFIFDSYMDVIAANSGVVFLFEIPANFIDAARSMVSGYNLMRIVFDSKSGFRALIGENSWNKMALSNARLFRAVTLRNRHTERFQKIMKELLSLREFGDYLDRAYLERDDFFTDSDFINYEHKTFGTLDYLYTSTTNVTPHGDLHFVTYTPCSQATAQVFESIFAELDKQRAVDESIPRVYTFASWPEKSNV